LVPEQTIHGRLSFSPQEGIYLELDGYLGKSRHGDDRTWPIICGETRAGDDCTLLEAHELSHSVSYHQVKSPSQISKLRATYCLVGHHFHDPSSLKFSSAAVEYSNLTAWMGRRPFARTHPRSENDLRHSLTFTQPPNIRISVKKLGFVQTFGCWFESGGESSQERGMRYGESVIFRPRRKQEFAWFVERMLQFRNLLCLLMVEPTKYERINLQFGKHLHPDPRIMIKDCVSLLFRQPWSEVKVRPLDSFFIPLDHSTIKREFPIILANWYERYGELTPVMDLFFLPIYNQSLNVEFQFLGLLQALEAFHRFTLPGSYLSVDEYKSTREYLVSQIPSGLTRDHKAALTSKIQYGYEFSFRKKLSRLVGVITKDTMRKITGGEDPDGFIGRVVVTRNYLTHYDQSLKDSAMSPVEMIRANHSLRIFLTLLILREIRVPADLALKRLTERGHLKLPIFPAENGGYGRE